MLKSFIKENYPLLIAVIVFIALLFPYWGILPYLDGNIDLVQAKDFYEGSYRQLFNNWRSIHPPVKVWLVSGAFKIFGVYPEVYSTIGMVFGLIGLTSLWQLLKDKFNRFGASLAVLLFASYPIVLANGLFAMPDFMLACLLPLVFYLYKARKIFLLTIVLVICSLIKETALLLPASILLTELIYFFAGLFTKKKALIQKIIPILLLIIPFIIFFVWHDFLSQSGKDVWSDWIFTDNPEIGSLQLVLRNIFTLGFINEFAFQNWAHLFILNYNWVFWIIILIAASYSLWQMGFQHKSNIFSKLKRGTATTKVIISAIIFFLIYCVAVLSFQTYTITRYVLPVIPLMLIATAGALSKLSNLLPYGKWIISILLIPFLITILFYSNDFISTSIWGTTEIAGKDYYSLHQHLSGNDGLVYNLQSASLAKLRSEIVIAAYQENRALISKSCDWMFPDPNNDFPMLDFFKLNAVSKQCVQY